MSASEASREAVEVSAAPRRDTPAPPLWEGDVIHFTLAAWTLTGLLRAADASPMHEQHVTTPAGSLPANASTQISIPFEQYQLTNGLNVILHHDTSLPQVVVNVWYGVGSKDEVAGRTGFAHLFEHLMFMGTNRVPGSGFDDTMEAHGGWNNAWTGNDATDYYDVGPSNLVDTFIWLEADRMDALGKAMTQEKLDLQREVVLNERRQSLEDTPYGVLWLELPGALYPKAHPYAHPVIGSHEDIEAATVDDVKRFFATWYVPDNASLVVAGDFDVARVKAAIQKYFGPLAPSPLPERSRPAPLDKPVKPVVEMTDQVQLPMTMLAWHSPAELQPGDAAYDLLGDILADGRSSRLYKDLVRSGIAVDVEANQYSQMLGSIFEIDAKPTAGHTIDEVEQHILDAVARIAETGPTAEEMQRVKNRSRVDFLHQLESLRSRASALNRYNYLVGDPGWIAQDLARYERLTPQDIQAAAAKLTPDRVCRLRVRPEKRSDRSNGDVPTGSTPAGTEPERAGDDR